jgi:hypothetical protein
VSDDRLEVALARWVRANLDGEPALEVMSADFVYEQHFGNTAGIYEGEAGMRRWIESFYEVWDRAQLEVGELRAAGDHCFGEFIVHVHAPQSGITVEIRAYFVASFDADRRIVRLDSYNEAEDGRARFAAIASAAS